jgi:prophage regulatory protein
MTAKKPTEREREEKRRSRKEARERHRAQARRDAAHAGQRILRLADVEAYSGLKYARIYELMAEGTFPRSVRLGPKAVGWVQSEIEAWVAARVAERDQGTALTPPDAKTR